MKLNKYGVNAQLNYNVLSSNTMYKLGFSPIAENHWHKCIILDRKHDITFSMSIPMDGVDDEIKIDVLDENFCQPYDYQYILANNPQHDFSNKIKNKVEAIMEELQEAGLINGFKKGMYI